LTEHRDSDLVEEPVQTEGGEALTVEAKPGTPATPQWFAVWTQSHCEQIVYDQLVAKQFEAYLPMMRTWSRRAGKRRLIPMPMFPGYLFVHRAIDKLSHIEILKTRGVVRILGEPGNRLVPVADTEIQALQQVTSTDMAVMPHPHLREGQRVRIEVGPLAGVEGILLRRRPSRGLLVLSVDLLCQSVAVEVDCTTVSPIECRSVPEGRITRALQCA
jgi:transcription termination/antitermination protein NusG